MRRRNSKMRLSRKRNVKMQRDRRRKVYREMPRKYNDELSSLLFGVLFLLTLLLSLVLLSGCANSPKPKTPELPAPQCQGIPPIVSSPRTIPLMVPETQSDLIMMLVETMSVAGHNGEVARLYAGWFEANCRSASDALG